MKEYVVYMGLRRDQVSDDIFDELYVQFPSKYNSNSLTFRLPIEHPKAKRLGEILTHKGLRPWPSFRPMETDEYFYRVHREYTLADIENSSFLRPFAPEIEGLHREWPSPAKLLWGTIRHRQRIVAGTTLAILAVRNEIKEAMLKAKLKGIKFSKLRLAEKASTEGRYWELTSKILLPPLAPGSILWTNKGQPFDGDYEKGCHLEEGFYADPELHFVKSAIEAEPAFDLAMTRERFGNGDTIAYPALVASRRFYQFCIDEGLDEMNWFPVRLDPG